MIKEFIYITATLLGFLIIIMYLAAPRKARSIGYIPCSQLNKYACPANWNGTPIDSKGRFVNHQYPYYQNYLKILIWLPSHALHVLKNRTKTFPVVKHHDTTFLNNEDSIIWLGHASFFLRINGLNILIDPHFYKAGPYKRHSAVPILPTQFTGIDYILITHDHADHFNDRSLQELIELNPAAVILTGARMDVLLKTIIPAATVIKTAEWYQQFDINDAPEIYFVPSRHYSHRVSYKYNAHLWGGFIIRYKSKGIDKTIYFEGDSAPGDHFKDIQELFNPDIVVMGIGAYEPQWMMHAVHMDPEEALKAAAVLKVKTFIPMHFGTFNLSNEKMDAPLQTLLEHSRHYPGIDIKKLIVGEVLPIE